MSGWSQLALGPHFCSGRKVEKEVPQPDRLGALNAGATPCRLGYEVTTRVPVAEL